MSGNFVFGKKVPQPGERFVAYDITDDRYVTSTPVTSVDEYGTNAYAVFTETDRVIFIDDESMKETFSKIARERQS